MWESLTEEAPAHSISACTSPVIVMDTVREVAECCSGLLLYTPEAYNCNVHQFNSPSLLSRERRIA